MAVKFTNNASATLASAITAEATSITVSSGQGALFPALAAGEFFYGTLSDSSNNLEIVKVTARTGDTMTVVRGQDGTTARAYAVGDKLELRVVAAALNNKVDADAPNFTGDVNITKATATFNLKKSGSGQANNIFGYSGTKLRWAIVLGDTAAESGASAGSNFMIGAYDDAGAFLRSALSINRNDGVISLGGPAYCVAQNSVMAQNNVGGSIRVQNVSGTGDSNMAMMTFLCQNQYGVKLGLRADGYFGLGGWSAAPWRWYVNTVTGDMQAAGNVIAFSDVRLKENIETIPSALEKVQKLRGVTFTRKDIEGKPRQLGVIAQEIREVIPEVVVEAPDGTLSVAYGNLVGLLIEAIKELAERVEELE